MNTKKAIAAIGILASAFAFGGGLYFVSGGDFRPCVFKYQVETTEPNQEVEVCPAHTTILWNWPHNGRYCGPWSIKTDGKETTMASNINVRSYYNGNGCESIEPIKHTYPVPGRHLVKLYDMKNNIYQVKFTNNPHIVSLQVNWENAAWFPQYGDVYEVLVDTCPKLESLVLRIPASKGGPMAKLNIGSGSPPMTKLRTLEISNSGVFTQAKGFNGTTNLVSGLDLPNVTNVLDGTGSPSTASFFRVPNIERIGGHVFNILDIPGVFQGDIDKAREALGDRGLKVLGIGDRLKYVGMNAFISQHNLKTIEFTTDEEDWIGTWNNNSVLVGWLGTAVAVAGKEDEATLIWPPDEVNDHYSTAICHVKADKVVRKRRTNQ